jgi:hypothetical protein
MSEAETAVEEIVDPGSRFFLTFFQSLTNSLYNRQTNGGQLQPAIKTPMSGLVKSMFLRGSVLLSVLRLTTILVLALALEPFTVGQNPASPPIFDPLDQRFRDVTEDFSSPSLSSSHLHPVRPLRGFFDDSHPDYTVELLQLQWRLGDPMDFYVIKPRGVVKPPVIINLYGFPADTDIYKNEVVQESLVKDGFAAVGFVSALTGQRYHDRPMRQWFLSELQESLSTSAHDVQMVLKYLTARGDFDMNRVGMFGQGSGATIAILASAADPRIKVLDVLDPWGDWPAWMATSPFVPQDERQDYVQPEFLKKVATLETLDWLPKIQAKKFRFQQNIFENATPKAVKEKLRAAAPPGTTFVFYQSPAEFVAAFGKKSTNLDWLKHELLMLPQSTGSTNVAASQQHSSPVN